MDHPNRSVANHCRLILEKIPSCSLVPFWVDLLDDEGEGNQQSALAGLRNLVDACQGEVDVDLLKPKLFEVLANSDQARSQYDTAFILIRLGITTDDLPDVVNALDRNPTAPAVWTLLGELGPAAVPAIPRIVEAHTETLRDSTLTTKT
ncbi:MAG TPA: hypothetical protein DD473_13845, partial [Planctomycetaceae bacterium]|nr:hypothetical protein [Planctomycetaceae bacterium]